MSLLLLYITNKNSKKLWSMYFLTAKRECGKIVVLSDYLFGRKERGNWRCLIGMDTTGIPFFYWIQHWNCYFNFIIYLSKPLPYHSIVFPIESGPSYLRHISHFSHFIILFLYRFLTLIAITGAKSVNLKLFGRFIFLTWIWKKNN